MKIIIPGNPIAKKRPRFARRGKFMAAINDQQTEEGKFLLLAREQINEQLSGPLVVSCKFVMSRPKGHYGAGRNSGILKPSAPQHHVGKPDMDNLIKFAWDCLNGAAWGDDAQIVSMLAWKRYGENPRTEVTITPYIED